MVHIMVQLSKYLIMLLFLAYTFLCVYALKKDGDKAGLGRIYGVQRALLLLIHFDAFLVLYLTAEDERLIFLYLAQLVFFAAVFTSSHLFYRRASELLLNNMCMLLAVGFFFLARLSYEQAFRQFLFACIGFAVSLLIPWAIRRTPVFRKLTVLYAAAGIGALALVAFAGSTSYGAKLNISIGPISIQPSEFVKIIFVLFLASMLCQKQNFLRILLTSVIAAAFVLMLVLSKDLGGALLYFIVFLFLVYSASRRPVYLAAGLCGLAGAALAGWRIFSHVQTRVLAWTDPLSVIDDEGYQISQSLFSIGTGGWFGLGLNQGYPKKIPVVSKDFIFSAISGEMGGVFALCLILVCVSCFLMIMHVSMRLKDPFYRLTAAGLGAFYAAQVFLTVGGVIKFIPSTGVTLPLVSYGGSSLLSTMILFGIVQGLYIMQGQAGRADGKKEREGDREFLVVSNIFSVLFLAMIAYFVYFQEIKSAEFIRSPYNSLQDLFAERVVRGPILSADGEVLARTRTKEDGEETREYPYGRVFAHAVGYVGNGRAGIENQENFALLSSHESLPLQVLGDIRGEKSQGDAVVTTLNAKIQACAYEALGSFNGALVALEPKTGKIIAMVSRPDYDPNTIAADWEEVTAEGSTALYNRAAQGKYTPGSIFKIFTTLEYYREHPAGYADFRFNCPGEFTRDGMTIHCASGKKHGEEDLKSAFANSCNAAYASLALTLDAERFAGLCDDLLFHAPLPVSFASGKSSTAITAEDGPALRMATAIGQGLTLVSPLHMAMTAAAIDNAGVLMKPFLVDCTKNASGAVVDKNEPQEYGRLITEDESELLTEFLRAVVTNGTARALDHQAYTVYGKTGTAQVSDSSDRTNAWFVGFARREGCEDLAVAVVLEDAGNAGAYAVPAAKRVFDLYFE